jgi:hypothetical protein
MSLMQQEQRFGNVCWIAFGAASGRKEKETKRATRFLCEATSNQATIDPNNFDTFTALMI